MILPCKDAKILQIITLLEILLIKIQKLTHIKYCKKNLDWFTNPLKFKINISLKLFQKLIYNYIQLYQ